MTTWLDQSCYNAKINSTGEKGFENSSQ